MRWLLNMKFAPGAYFRRDATGAQKVAKHNFYRASTNIIDTMTNHLGTCAGCRQGRNT